MFPAIIATLLLALVIFTAWNLLSSRRHFRRLPSSNAPLDDSKYYELKYKQEFLVAAFLLVAGVAAFLGINTKDSIEKNLKGEIEEKLKEPKQKIDSVSGTVALIDTALNKIKGRTDYYQDRIALTEKTQSQIIRKAREYGKAMEEVLSRIKQINEKNILK